MDNNNQFESFQIKYVSELIWIDLSVCMLQIIVPRRTKLRERDIELKDSRGIEKQMSKKN